jgi:uncharacterized Zn finger protein
MARWSDFPYFPPSQPLEARGGIKARSKGGFGKQWWSRRWVAVLEALNLGGRLQRGRSYARRGQVLSIEIEPERVSAEVQGSRPTPYRITIAVKPLAGADRSRVAAAVAESPLHVAKLMAGEMPEDIESLFDRAGVSLFPARASELRTDCSCPDWSNPCKHIAAVYYLLGEEFDRDPFLIFRLRGIAREEIVELMGSRSRPTAPRKAPRDERPPIAAGKAAPEHFWEGTAPDGDLFGVVEPPPRSAPILRRLGPFPFWRGEEDLLDALAPLYPAAVSIAAAALVGERRMQPEEPPPERRGRRRPRA